MDGAGKKLLMFMESAQQQLGGGVWAKCGIFYGKLVASDLEVPSFTMFICLRPSAE